MAIGLRAVVVAVAVTVLAGAVGVCAAGAEEDAAPHQKLLDGTVRFLQEHQLESGAYADSGTKPSQSISAWATMALAAAGINPLDQIRTVGGVPCGHSAQEFLEGHLGAGFAEEIASPQVGTTAFERELLVADAAGTDPHDFGGQDLVKAIVERQGADGGIPYVPGGAPQVNDAVFGILALAPIAEPEAEAAVHEAKEWLLGAGDDDGGFNWQGPGAPSEADLTGAVIEALVAAGEKGAAAQAGALAFLRSAQRPDGGFAEYPATEGESNVASTAWGVQGIWASGGDPETWRTGSGLASEEPLDYMESLQQEDGHVRWKASSDQNGIWMTAYVLPAFAGQVLPYPEVPRAAPATERLASCGEGAAAPTAPAGHELSGAKPGQEEGGSQGAAEGVGAGGGGEGAPDFSRPRPGSKGKTPGGARVRSHAGAKQARDHASTRRGANLRQASGTETEEPRRPSEADQETGAVSAGAAGAGDGRGQAASAGGGPGAGGVPLAAADAARSANATTGEEVSGAVIGSPAGRRGKLAFGAPGLRSATGGGDEEPWVPLAIGAAALAVLGLGARRELRGHNREHPA